MSDAWGYHSIFDLKGCNLEKITSKSCIEEFAKKLVETIEMVAFGDPMVVHFGDGDKEGFTLVQLIETSNITGHFCNSSGEAYIDIFSCKEFDQAKAIGVVFDSFNPTDIDVRSFLRGKR